jgi:5'(3')-deoxyribonucleotidase
VKRLYVDMDNVLVDFPCGVARLEPELARAYEGRLDEVPGIFALMPPVRGALEAYATLARRFDTYVLSTAPWENPSAWSDKLLWVKRHLGDSARKRLILTHHKDLNLGDYLIDDRTKNGAERFRGEHIHFGTERFPDWDAVLAYLLPRA